MTNKEALSAKAQCTVPDASLDVVLIDKGIDPNGVYTAGNTEDIELACVDLLFGMYTQQDVSEGGYSISHPDFLRKIKERILFFARKYKLDDIILAVDPKPSVTGKSVW